MIRAAHVGKFCLAEPNVFKQRHERVLGDTRLIERRIEAGATVAVLIGSNSECRLVAGEPQQDDLAGKCLAERRL